jgi:hypothetical protein
LKNWGWCAAAFFHNGAGLYEINLDDSHHYHIVCKSCGKVERIDASLTDTTERMLRERGYEPGDAPRRVLRRLSRLPEEGGRIEPGRRHERAVGRSRRFTANRR